MLSRLRKALPVGVLVALLGALAGILPPTLRLEEDVGLGMLFRLRGPRPAPPEVIVVSLDRVSSDALGQPNDPSKWPRRLHAELVDRLVTDGAQTIGFDVRFDDRSASDPAGIGDQQLGESFARAGNVVLTAALTKTAIGGTRDGGVLLTAESVVSPVVEVAAGASAIAPFPLPVVPVKVSQFWTYKATAGGIPTFPSAVFQTWMLQQSGAWLDDVQRLCPNVPGRVAVNPDAVLARREVVTLLREARRCLGTDPASQRELQRAWQARLREQTFVPLTALRSLFELYAGSDTRYLNYYGPPRTVITIPYPQALKGDFADLRGKIVLVGFSEQFQPEQRDGFYSVFSDDSGLDLSGVEIAATAVANMVDGTAVRPLPLPSQLLVIALWGLLAGSLCRWLSPMVAVAFCAAAALFWGTWALWVFDKTNIWLPTVLPVLLQLPVALLLGLLAQYRQTQGQRQRVLDALGAYLPKQAVDRLMENLGDLKDNAELLHGTCLATDGERYTQLSESLSPEALATLMNDYYEELFSAVESAGGVVTDVVGDSMMAIWAAASADDTTRTRACNGALAVAAAVDRFNSSPGRARLPTRLGLHSGPIRLGNIGGKRRVEFRATGDIVNTASRIESLNKTLGTRILVSAETLEAVTGFDTREVGTFLLSGKSIPVVLYELVPPTGSPSSLTPARRETFSAALSRFRTGDWRAAAAGFRELAEGAASDGPSRYYAALCGQYLATGADSFVNGAVRIDQK